MGTHTVMMNKVPVDFTVYKVPKGSIETEGEQQLLLMEKGVYVMEYVHSGWYIWKKTRRIIVEVK